MSDTAAEILEVVEEAFPHVARPADGEMTFHGDGCFHCEMALRELRERAGDQLPFSSVRWFYGELGTLSAKATAWILPVYLRFVLTAEDPLDPLPTKFLIYDLSPTSEHEADTRERLRLLNRVQIGALLALVEYWRQQPDWSDYDPDLQRAARFLGTILPEV